MGKNEYTQDAGLVPDRIRTSDPRKTNPKRYRDNYDTIFGEKPEFLSTFKQTEKCDSPTGGIQGGKP